MRWTSALALLASAMAASLAWTAPLYTIERLFLEGTPTALNNAGQIISGFSPTSLYTNGRRMILPIHTGYDLNDAGHVVGESSVQPVLYSGGVVTDLGTLDRFDTGFAVAINNAGQVAGTNNSYRCCPLEYIDRAVLYSGGTVTDLGVLPGGRHSGAVDINNAGQVAGISGNYQGFNRATLYSQGVLTELGVLPGGRHSYSSALNDLGQVIGYSETLVEGQFYPRSFLYSSGTLTDLGVLPGDTHSAAYAINNQGQIVGWSQLLSDIIMGELHVTLYDKGTLYNLQTLLQNGEGWEVRSAVAINDRGQILGSGFLRGKDREFLLTPVLEPVPEPGSFGLVGAALLAVVVMRRRTRS